VTTTLKTVLLAGAAFVTLAVAIVAASFLGYISGQLGLLMLVALLGMYVGFGVLIAVYRFISRLE
jgi:hypothetical protein